MLHALSHQVPYRFWVNVMMKGFSFRANLMNAGAVFKSKRKMLFFLTYSERRMLYWKLAHYGSRIRMHQKIVFASVVLGAALGLFVSLATPPVYAARVTLKAGTCHHGVLLEEGIVEIFGFCSRCEEEALPKLVRLARKLDSAALKVGWTNMHFESTATNLLGGRTK